jgi:hypothetical protein
MIASLRTSRCDFLTPPVLTRPTYAMYIFGSKTQGSDTTKSDFYIQVTPLSDLQTSDPHEAVLITRDRESILQQHQRARHLQFGRGPPIRV